MTDDKKTHQCFICGKKFQHEEHIYGHWISKYQIEVCSSCFNNNWDGWPGDRTEKIIKHLKDNSLSIPQLNEKGWLPRG
jgi:5-methylcytosine-specific restriction endonuclease McrA